MSIKQIQNNLNIAAEIVRKYDLGDKQFFFNKFNNIDSDQLEIAWEFALQKIQNKEIVKDANNIADIDSEFANKIFLIFGDNYKAILHHLKIDFDSKKFKISGENTERRLRRLFAEKYIDFSVKEISKQSKRLKNAQKYNSSYILNKFKLISVILGIILLISLPRIIRGLTSVETLTERIHEKSKYEYRIGAICSDGWDSNATGKGACSHHGGVNKWIYKKAYYKTISESKEEARKISWFD